MSQSAITTAFENYLASQLAAGEPVTLDQFIFANVPDLEPDAPIDRENEVIPVDYIVYQQAVTLPGVINENEVVYSVTMGTDVGDFDFNWIGLVNQATGLLAMVTHAPVQQKFMNASGQQGNTLTRSFLMEYSGAAVATNITTPAETWQIDFTARLMSMDDRQRLENTDIYGDGAFFDDGFLVTGSLSDGYLVGQGAGYVGGLRVNLTEPLALDADVLPAKVWVDACWKGTLTSVWLADTVITVADTLENYIDAQGLAHYVFAVASVDVDGVITDLRPQGSRDNQQLSDYLRIKQNLAEIAVQGAEAQTETRENIGCGTAATGSVVTSSDDATPGRIPKVGWMGWGGPEISIADGTDIYKFFPTALSGNYGGGGDLPNTLTGGWRSFKWQQHGSDHKYGFLLEVGSGGQLAVHVYNNQNGDMTSPENYWQNGSLFYSTGYKPTAADTGALPIGGGTLTGDLYLDKSYNIILKETSGANPVNFYMTPWCDAGETGPYLEFYAVKSTDASARQNLFNAWLDTSKLKAGTTISTGAKLTVYGQVIPNDYGNFDARYYTQSAANAKFVQGVQFGASASHAVSNNQTFNTAGYCLTGFVSDGNNDDVDSFYAKPIQKNINGTWATISG